MRRFRWLSVFFCMLLLIFAAGCPGGEQRKPVPSPTKIAVSLADMSRDGNKTIQQLMKERGRKEQLDITFMNAGNDPLEQEKHIDRMVQEKVRAAVIQFVDPREGPRMVQKLKQENIKVVALQNLPENTPVDAYIASDHTRAGELQVRCVQEALLMAAQVDGGRQGGGQQGQQGSQQGGGQQGQQGGDRQQGSNQGQQGQDPARVTQALDPAVAFQLPQKRPLQVLVLQGDSRDQSSRQITAANIEAIEASPDLSLLKVQEHPYWDPSPANAVLAEFMASGQQPDVVLANDSSLAMAAVEFFKQAGMDKRVITIGVGADEKSSMGIMNGEHEGEVDPMPEMLGQYALDAASDLAENEHWQFDRRVQNGDYDVPAKIIPVRLIGKNNIYLLQDRWKKLKEQQEQQGSQQQGQQGGNRQGQQNRQGSQGGTTLKITTEEGKIMEVQIDGTVKKIESTEGGGNQQQGGQEQGQQGGGGGE